MPPLLPEYLIEPVLIVIRSAGKSWWEPLVPFLAPVIGLVGVALGAAISRSQERRRIKLEKIEEIVSLSSELEKNFIKYAKGFLAELYETESGEVHRQTSSGPVVHDLNRQMEKLSFLMMVHMPNRDNLRKKLCDCIISAGTKITLIGASPNVEASEVDPIKLRMQSMLAHITFAQKDIQKAAVIDSKKLVRQKFSLLTMFFKR